MIAGIGSDLVAQDRIASVVERFGARFAVRILTEREFTQFHDRRPAQQVRFLAQRFAAKEAFSKALGTGIGAQVGWRDIGVHNESTGETAGRPLLHWSAALGQHLAASGIGAAHVTLTDEAGLSHALVILERTA